MQGASIFKQAGHVPPKDVIEQILGQYPDCHGFAFIHKSGNNLSVIPSSAPITADQVVEWMTKAKDKSVLFCAYKIGHGEKLEADKLPPYTVLETTDGKPAVVAVLHGDFSDFYRKDSSLPPEYLAVQDDLIDRVKGVYNSVNGNMEELMEELYTPRHKRQLVNCMASEHGVILLFSFTDELLMYAKTEESMVQHDWGYHTMLGEPVAATEPAAPAEEEEEDLEASLATIVGGIQSEPEKEKSNVNDKPSRQPGSRQPQARTGNSGDAVVRGSVPATSNTVPASATQQAGAVRSRQPGAKASVVPSVPRSDTSSAALDTAATNAGESLKVDPNMELTITIPPMGVDKKAKWMRKRIPGEQLPRNFSEWTEIKVKAAEATKAFWQTFAEQNKLKGIQIMKAFGMRQLGTGEVVLEGKKEQPKGITQQGNGKPITESRQPRAAQPTQSHSTNGAGNAPVVSNAPTGKDTAPHTVGSKAEAGAIPLIPKTERDSLAQFMAKPETKQAVDHHFQFIKDPKNISSLEKKYPSLQEGGYLKHLEDVHGWPPEVFHSIVKDQPTFAGNLLFYLALDHMKLFDQITDPGHKTETAPQQEPEKPEQPKVEPEPMKATGTDGAPPPVRSRQPGARIRR